MRSPDAVLNAKAHEQAWNNTIWGGQRTVDWDCYIEYINEAGETVGAELAIHRGLSQRARSCA